jgi:hypothetical protein
VAFHAFAFRDHVLKEIFKEIKSPTRPFTITFSKENGFSVTTHEPPKETSKNLLKNKDDQVRKFDFSNPGQEKTLEANKAIQQILFLSTGSKANFHLQQNSLSLSWKTLSNSILSNATIEAQQKPLPHSSSQKTSNRVISTQNCEKPRGIPQTDNNCWASTMLQLLLISEPSRQWLEEHKSEREEKLKALHTFYQKVTGRQSLTSQDVSNIRKMATTLLHPEQNESTESNAQGFLSLIQNVASNVFGSQQNESTQEDLEEGLSAILEAILPKQYTNETIIYENSTQKQVSVIERKNPECVSDSILKLKIPTDSKNPDVKQLLDFYFTQNKKQIGERYIQNEQTNNVKYDATKAKTKYAQCPSELWLSIGRWKSDLSKNQVSVDIQREITITDERGNTQTYRLNGIGHHQGNSQNSGHYVSDIRKGNQWFRCDGTQVTESSAYSKEIIPSKTAYILHYEKVISQEIN